MLRWILCRHLGGGGGEGWGGEDKRYTDIAETGIQPGPHQVLTLTRFKIFFYLSCETARYAQCVIYISGSICICISNGWAWTLGHSGNISTAAVAPARVTHPGNSRHTWNYMDKHSFLIKSCLLWLPWISLELNTHFFLPSVYLCVIPDYRFQSSSSHANLDHFQICALHSQQSVLDLSKSHPIPANVPFMHEDATCYNSSHRPGLSYIPGFINSAHRVCTVYTCS